MYDFFHKTKGIYDFGIKRFCFFATIAVATAFGSACSSGPKSYGIKAEGDQRLNRDINGRSLSVVIRIYQLKDAKEFSKMTFDTVADGRPDSELLGPALLEKTDIVLLPGGSHSSTEKLLDDTKYIGIVAFFRRPDQHHWRQLVDADSVRSNGLLFKAQDCFLVINGMKAVTLPDQLPNARPECASGNATTPRANSGTPPATQQQNGMAASSPSQRRGGNSQATPDIKLKANTPVGAVNIQVDNGGNTAIGIGEAADTGSRYLKLPR